MSFKRPASILITATVLGAVGCTAIAAVGPAPDDLGWLEGCWAHDSGDTEEHWINARDGLLFGHSVTVHNGRVVAFEDLRIEPGANGPVYVASPGGRPSVSFQHTDSGNSRVVFENPAHDFPQRISYERTEDQLIASVSTLDGDQEIAFPMTACTSVSPEPAR